MKNYRLMLLAVLAAGLGACGGDDAQEETAPADEPVQGEDEARLPSREEKATVKVPASRELDFGDDTAMWSNDGQCDDPRFTGPGISKDAIDMNLGHDASDCRAAFEAGRIWRTYEPAEMTIDDINFGADKTPFAKDGTCQDPRFGGPGASDTFLMNRAMDATDCRGLFKEGKVWLK